MNLQHLKYALEVAKTSSITKAAENLYMGQPSLSRAIRELEEGLGAKIFVRTSRGVMPTERGKNFLEHARRILAEVDAAEGVFKMESGTCKRLSVSATDSPYVLFAFTEFCKTTAENIKNEIIFKTSGFVQTVADVSASDLNIGIVSSLKSAEDKLYEYIERNNLIIEPLGEYSKVIAVSAAHPIAYRGSITTSELERYIEIGGNDSYQAAFTRELSQMQKKSIAENKRITVPDFRSRISLLTAVAGSYMRTPPIPHEILNNFGLHELDCADDAPVYRDYLILRYGYQLTDTDRAFIDILKEYCPKKREYYAFIN